MTYYLYRATPLHDWSIISFERLTTFDGGETIALPDCHYYGQAAAERDKANGKANWNQGVLGL